MIQDLKEKIITTAETLFYENGYENTSLRNVADKLGIHHSNILYYFDSKKALGNVIYGRLYNTISSQILKLIPDKDKYYLATNLRLHYKVMYWDKKIFRLYSEFINAGIVTEYILPNAVENYKIYTSTYGLNYTDEELSSFFHIAQGIEQRFINLIVNHSSPISFEKAIDVILSAPLLYMGLGKKEIENIISQSITNINQIPNSAVEKIVKQLTLSHVDD